MPSRMRSIYEVRTPCYFSNVFTFRGLALTHLPKCSQRRDHPWVPHATDELQGRDLQNATNDICEACLAQSDTQSMQGLIEQLSAVVQLEGTTDWISNP